MITPSAIRMAIRSLETQTVLSIDAAQYRRLVHDGRQPASGKYLYLARAGVMTPVSLSGESFVNYAMRASYTASSAHSADAVHIVSLMTSETRQVPRNFVVVLESPSPIREVFAYCLGGR
jgi:hypothetical protein